MSKPRGISRRRRDASKLRYEKQSRDSRQLVNPDTHINRTINQYHIRSIGPRAEGSLERRYDYRPLLPAGENYHIVPSDDEEYRALNLQYNPQFFDEMNGGLDLDNKARTAAESGERSNARDPIPFWTRDYDTRWYALEPKLYFNRRALAAYSEDRWVSSALHWQNDLLLTMLRSDAPDLYKPYPGLPTEIKDDYWHFAVTNSKKRYTIRKGEHPILAGAVSQLDRTLVITHMFKNKDRIAAGDPEKAHMSDILFSTARDMAMRRNPLDNIATFALADLKFVYIDKIINPATKAIIIWAFTMRGVSLARRDSSERTLRFSRNNPDDHHIFYALLRTPNVAPFLRSFMDHVTDYSVDSKINTGWGAIEVTDIFVKYKAEEERDDDSEVLERKYDKRNGWHDGDGFIGLRLGKREGFKFDDSGSKDRSSDLGKSTTSNISSTLVTSTGSAHSTTSTTSGIFSTLVTSTGSAHSATSTSGGQL